MNQTTTQAVPVTLDSLAEAYAKAFRAEKAKGTVQDAFAFRLMASHLGLMPLPEIKSADEAIGGRRAS